MGAMPHAPDILNVLQQRRNAYAMPLTLVCVDIALITAVFAATVYCRHLIGGDFLLHSYWVQWPVVLLYVLAIASFGGYNMLLTRPQELRATTLATLLIIALLSSMTYWMRFDFQHSRAVLLIGATLLLALLPMAHFSVKHYCARFSWWGYRTVFYLFEKKETHYIRMLVHRLHSCLKPVLLLRHQEDSLDGQTLEDVPTLDGPEFLSLPGQRIDGIFIFLGYPQRGSGARLVLRRAEARFTKTIILHESLNYGNQWARPVEMGHHLGLEIIQRLLDPRLLLAKRCVDVLMAALLLVLFSPLLLTIALAIVVTSPGPVFFRHTRLGRGGIPFKAWKFRTMVPNAGAALERILAADPKLREEWQASQKLANDPRITRLGAFLRRSSLDELPQLFNVISGDMSLIGPRPIVKGELARYGESYEMVSRVRPGMTGLWQVSGRSRLPYAARVELDTYYIKNWSFWLDMYILLKTPFAVLNFTDAM
jgi:Undecaprenyl-phosphate galactose phosphotransferase WbaP